MCVRSEGRGPVEVTSEGAAPELGSSDSSAVLTGRPSPLRDPLTARQSNGTANSHDMASDAIYFYSQDESSIHLLRHLDTNYLKAFFYLQNSLALWYYIPERSKVCSRQLTSQPLTPATWP